MFVLAYALFKRSDRESDLVLDQATTRHSYLIPTFRPTGRFNSIYLHLLRSFPSHASKPFREVVSS